MPEQPKPTPAFAVVHGETPAGHALRGAVVAIGNFDGVHRGHQAVIATARQRAAALGRPAAALTFEPHPRSFFRPQEPLFRLTDERNKLRLLASTGLDGAIVLRFDAALAALSADDFVERILLERLAVSGVTIGFDFHFGANRTGSPDFLAAAGARHGFAVDVVPRFEDNGRRISSGPIRAALGDGHVVRRRRDARLPLVRIRRGGARRQARARARLSDRQSAARSDLRAAARNLCRAHRCRRPPSRRRGELRAPSDVRRRHGAARSLPVRFLRRPLRADDRCRVHRMDQARDEIRQHRRPGTAHGRRQRHRARRAGESPRRVSAALS